VRREIAVTTSTWIALARRESDLGSLLRRPGWTRLGRRAGMRLWTDDYTDVLAVVRWK
jgi:hypothetical protein